jgi:hypothetical protein
LAYSGIWSGQCQSARGRQQVGFAFLVALPWLQTGLGGVALTSANSASTLAQIRGRVDACGWRRSGVDETERMARPSVENAANSATVLDVSCRYPQLRYECRHHLSRLLPENVGIFLGGPRTGPTTSSGGAHSIRSDSGPSCSAWSIFRQPLSRSEPCRMAQRQS